MNQTKTESTIVAATIPRKRIRHIVKRSSGRTPSVYANDGMPGSMVWDADVDTGGGSVKRALGTERSMNNGDVGSTSWSEKFDDGANGGTNSGET